MNKREAKREACFIASGWLISDLGSCDLGDRYTDQEWELIVLGMEELIAELHRRGWKEHE